MQFVKPQLFTEAVAKIGAQSPIGSKLNSEEWRRVPAALRESAFFSATVENVRFLQQSQDFISDFLKGTRAESGALKAGGRAQFVKEMSAFAIEQGMGNIDGSTESRPTGGLQDITSQARLSLIFNTKVTQAQSFGYWQQGMDPDVLDAFPAQHLMREQDVEEPRNQHTRYEGEVRLKTDLGFWIAINQDFGVPWGPWGWGCGHGVEDDDRARAEELGLLAPGQRVEPAKRDLNERLQASVKNLAPELRAKLKEQFGGQIVIEGDTARWVGEKAEVGGQKAEVELPAVVPPPLPPAPAPQPKPPVSAALRVTIKDKQHRGRVQRAIEIIDSIHSDGVLPSVEVGTRAGRKALGTYYKNGNEIGVRKAGSHPELTMIHETGHLLDDLGIGKRGQWASEGDVLTAGWRLAIEGSAAYQRLVEAQAAMPNSATFEYLLRGRELFARSYAQYIAEKSGDARLLQQVENLRGVFSARQWATDDFAPIRAAFDKLFQKLGWL